MKATIRLSAIGLCASLTALCHTPVRANCLGGDQTLGAVCITAANFCPKDYALANGAILQVSEHNDLFRVIGNKYGGDGKSTFALPNMMPKRIVHATDQSKLLRCMAMQGRFPATSAHLSPDPTRHNCPDRAPGGKSMDLIGAICSTAAATCPPSHIPADGRVLEVNENYPLFSLVGWTYGGDGKTTFRVPDLNSQQAADSADHYMGQRCISVIGIYPAR